MFVNKLKQLPFGKLVFFTFGTLCAILLVTGGLFYFSLRSIERSNQLQQSRALNKLALNDDAAQDVGQMQAGVLLQILASDTGEIKHLEENVRAIGNTNARELAEYQKFIDTEKERQLYDRAMQTRKAYWEQTQHVLRSGSANQDSEAIKFINTTQAPAYDKYLKAVSALIDYVETDTKEAVGTMNRFVSEIRIIGNALIGLTVLMVIGTGFAVARITRRLKEDNRFLQIEIAERKRAEEELKWKTAFLEAQVNSSIDGILVVDQNGEETSFQNQRFVDLFKFPPHIVHEKTDENRLRWVTDMTKNPEQFVKRVLHLYAHRDETGRDEIELKDGTILDRYSAPVVGGDGKYYGRIWTFRDITEARRTEHELKEANVAAVLREGAQSYNFLADSVPLIIWTGRTDGRVDYYNKAWFDYTGLTLEQTEEWGWGAVLHPDDLKPCIERWTRSFTTGENYEIEYRFKRASDETYRWFLGRASPRRNEEGEIMQWVGTCTDIEDQKRAEEELRRARSSLEDRVAERTAELAKSNEALHAENVERKQTEQALQRQQAELKALFDLIPAIVIFKDTKNNILRVNKRAAQIIGKSVEEIEGKSTLKCFPEGAEKVYKDDLEVIQSGLPKLAFVEGHQERDGKVRWVQTDKVPYRDEDGKVIGILALIQDITERKRTEESLQLLGSAVRQSKESIVITDAELDLPGPRIVFVNPSFTKMTGYTEEEAIGKTPRILQGPLTDKAVLSRLRKNLELGEAFEGEAINYRKDGKEFYLEWQIAPIRNAGGKITHFVAVQHDITERKRLETHLFQSQKMETVGKLAGGVAHEFNSIMTAIIGQSELLLTDLPPGDPLCRNATEIRTAAERAAILTRQLLAYGRKQILQPKIIDLNAVLTGMESTLRHLVGRGTDVRITPAAGLKAVKADAGQIEQVIMNMVMNASDAMPNGGKLTLETANVTLAEEYTSGFPDLKAGEYVMLAITDTGTGISEEVKGRIFEPFFSTKAIGHGTGLGLSTCYGIIKQSGGHIGVYSEPGRGTTFKVYLPQVEHEAKVSIQRQQSLDLPPGTETILLVDDDPALRMMAATLLRRLGYTVLAAADGIEALRLQQQSNTGHVDLLFTDVVMPNMSGKELADRVVALSPRTRTLFTSAYTENAIVHQGVLDKDVALLQKPFTPSALAHKLREVLDAVAQTQAGI